MGAAQAQDHGMQVGLVRAARDVCVRTQAPPQLSAGPMIDR